ncbi:MerR family transcriptional regulator [Chloracidobacterium thermophilum]|jgi:DNA-binding transcriptional MerR regulator|uniref:MerR family transcriptional regulator n=1 Tax=Chloracidobacterium thermophilum TaxID=458033 RepID=UPI0011D2083B|nr:MerR family transcriptional regulator [Chloracidobacterium thermophilum]QUV78324.1 MerR family transcriptional regulator [Chloracidobacterium thermophilum]QUV81364.1 MerR family transcriptional regulator [Chloracidobacterium sp. D]
MAYSSEGRRTVHTIETPRGKVSIPDKLYFKIGEVCEIVGVEPHVLRYWEQEFPQLAPQKSAAGQRLYRRKDVEIALRIKTLREDEGFTIAGAKKRLSAERAAAGRLKVVPIERPAETTADTGPAEETPPTPKATLTPSEALATLRQIRTGLEDILTLLRNAPR